VAALTQILHRYVLTIIVALKVSINTSPSYCEIIKSSFSFHNVLKLKENIQNLYHPFFNRVLYYYYLENPNSIAGKTLVLIERFLFLAIEFKGLLQEALYEKIERSLTSVHSLVCCIQLRGEGERVDYLQYLVPLQLALLLPGFSSTSCPFLELPFLLFDPLRDVGSRAGSRISKQSRYP
jgi:hypothetical protein